MGINWMNAIKGSKPIPSAANFAPIVVITVTTQLDTGAMMQIGAAVESMMYESFARDTLNLSVTGRITVPTVRQLK